MGGIPTTEQILFKYISLIYLFSLSVVSHLIDQIFVCFLDTVGSSSTQFREQGLKIVDTVQTNEITILKLYEFLGLCLIMHCYNSRTYHHSNALPKY